MGVVIPLFKDQAPAVEPFNLDDLSETYLESIGEVVADLETIFACVSRADFVATMKSVKARVGEWPDG